MRWVSRLTDNRKFILVWETPSIKKISFYLYFNPRHDSKKIIEDYVKLLITSLTKDVIFINDIMSLSVLDIYVQHETIRSIVQSHKCKKNFFLTMNRVLQSEDTYYFKWVGVVFKTSCPT